MKTFTTELGEFIAVPIDIDYSIEEVSGILPNGSKIIGITTDIIKSDELAAKVCKLQDWSLEVHEFKYLIDREELNDKPYLIIKKI